MNEKQANKIMYRLIEENCFAENGRLGIYPQWLKHDDIEFLVSIGMFRREPGNLENYMHVDYFLNDCCAVQALSNECAWPNCTHYHFQKHTRVSSGTEQAER